jgi:hypothetical protein
MLNVKLQELLYYFWNPQAKWQSNEVKDLLGAAESWN